MTDAGSCAYGGKLYHCHMAAGPVQVVGVNLHPALPREAELKADLERGYQGCPRPGGAVKYSKVSNSIRGGLNLRPCHHQADAVGREELPLFALGHVLHVERPQMVVEAAALKELDKFGIGGGEFILRA